MNKGGYLLLIIICVSCLAPVQGCGGGGGDSSVSPPSVDACSAVGLRIINGAACSAPSNSIVRLTLFAADGTVNLCSGSLISSDRVLTAAHCFLLAPVVAVDLDVGGERSSGTLVSVHPQARIDTSNLAVFNDVAIVQSAEAFSSPVLPILLSTSVEVNDPVLIYGFGLDENGDAGALRAGAMTISGVSENHLFARFSGEGANTCNGDSGGPALRFNQATDGTASSLSVVGVTSSGDPTTQCLDGDTTLFANVQNSEILDFILSVAPEAGVI